MQHFLPRTATPIGEYKDTEKSGFAAQIFRLALVVARFPHQQGETTAKAILHFSRQQPRCSASFAARAGWPHRHRTGILVFFQGW